MNDGTLVDAIIVEQSRGKKRDDGTSTRDPEASFTKNIGQTYHGYKGHISVGCSTIVTDYRFSDAAPHNSNFIDELTQDEKQMVVADSAYRSEVREAELTSGGVACAIIFIWKKRAKRTAISVEEAESIDRVGACESRASLRVDEEHEVSTSAVPRRKTF